LAMHVKYWNDSLPQFINVQTTLGKVVVKFSLGCTQVWFVPLDQVWTGGP
jgi:hypothetical protein